MIELLGLIIIFLDLKSTISISIFNINYDFFFLGNTVKDLSIPFFNFFEKSHLLYFMNVLNFIKYIFYSNIKNIMLHLYYYVFQFFLIVVYNNGTNKFVKNYIYYYYILKKSVLKIKKYIMLGYIKKWRFWRSYYRFYHISYLKVLFFFLLFVLFILMWKRRNTYLKRMFLWNFILYYMFSVFISFLLWPLFFNKCLVICLSLLISFFIIFLKLN